MSFVPYNYAQHLSGSAAQRKLAIEVIDAAKQIVETHPVLNGLRLLGALGAAYALLPYVDNAIDNADLSFNFELKTLKGSMLVPSTWPHLTTYHGVKVYLVDNTEDALRLLEERG